MKTGNPIPKAVTPSMRTTPSTGRRSTDPMMEPRLRTHYRDKARPALQEEFELRPTRTRSPRLEKIVVNCRDRRRAASDQKLLDSVVDEITTITGQKPVITRARKSISNFSAASKGMPVGASA